MTTQLREAWLDRMTTRLAPLFEAVGAPLPGKVREMISLAGLGMILLIMFVAFKNDIMRLLGQ